MVCLLWIVNENGLYRLVKWRSSNIVQYLCNIPLKSKFETHQDSKYKYGLKIINTADRFWLIFQPVRKQNCMVKNSREEHSFLVLSDKVGPQYKPVTKGGGGHGGSKPPMLIFCPPPPCGKIINPHFHTLYIEKLIWINGRVLYWSNTWE